MAILIHPQTQRQEEELLAFLTEHGFEYSYEDFALSAEQRQEILVREEEYESGKAETFSFDEIIDYFESIKN